MSRVRAVGFWNDVEYIPYPKPFEFKEVKYSDGEFLMNPLTGNLVADKIDGKYYLRSQLFTSLEFDHVLKIEEIKEKNKNE